MITTSEMPSRFGIAPYQAHAFGMFLDHFSFVGKRVLEVGGSNLPAEFVIGTLQAKEWVSIDVIGDGAYQLLQQADHYKSVGIRNIGDASKSLGSHEYLIFDGRIEQASDLPQGYFDIVLSITSFEHVLAYGAALKTINYLKQSNGVFASYHGPLWSCIDGHHIWVDDELNFTVPGSMPAFGHLLYSPPELLSILSPRYGFERAQEAVLQTYHLPRINRLFYEDHAKYLQSEFRTVHLEPYGVGFVDEAILTQLELRYPFYKRFDAYGLFVVAS